MTGTAHVFRFLRYGLLLALGALVNLLIGADGVRSALPPRAPAPAADADTTPRVVVVGFDGLDPRWLERYFAEDRLPNLRRMRDEGNFLPLRTEIPPESPVAWASLLTGVNPGRHGIFDFVRPGAGYRPENGMVDFAPMRLALGRVPVRPPRAASRLRAPTFLRRVHEAGYRVISLREPLAFPVPDRPGMSQLSGLGTPDLAGSAGFYAVWSAQIGFVPGETIFGGTRIPLGDGGGTGRYETRLPGPYDPTLVRDDRGGRRKADVPLRFEIVDADGAPAVRVTLAGRSETVAVGERSGFFVVPFRLGTVPAVDRTGAVRFEVLGTNPLKVMADAVQPYAMDAAFPLSSPPGYAGDLWSRYGAYETIGWSEQTFALNDLVQSDPGFLRDLLDDMDRGAAILLGEMRRDAHCVFYAFTATDRALHGFYRYYDEEHPLHEDAKKTGLVDPFGQVLERADRIVGDVRAGLGPDDLLLVVSDHGFQTWRWGMNVNRWLREEGYLVMKGEVGERRLGTFFGGADMDVDAVDWTRTRAYAMGLGQVYLNRRGREEQGIVTDEEVPALLDEIEAKITAYENPYRPGERPVKRIFRLHDPRTGYAGPHVHEAAEIQLAFENGYRVSWQTALLGGMDKPVIEANAVPWSGDHCSTDPDQVPGVLLSNRPLPPGARERGHHLRDVAATVLEWFAVPWSDLDATPIVFR